MVKRLDYVLSGASYARLVHSYFYDNPKLLTIGRAMVKRVMKESKYHTLSVLYNAFVEKHYGPKLKQALGGVMHSIHADSGGLQIVTRGMAITQQLKDDIYRNQAAYSTMAMSFDEIPISMLGERSARLDMTSRWFEEDKFEACAKATGKNLNDQINTFRGIDGCKTKPIMIMQGNGYDTYMRWCELVVGQVTEENTPFIGGIAMGSAALGNNDLEDIQKTFYYTQLPFKTKPEHMHILGVGSVKRLLPVLALMSNGLLSQTSISYDSTTHSSGIIYGRYTAKNGPIDYNRTFTKEYQMILSDIVETFPLDWDIDRFFNALNSGVLAYEEKNGNREDVVLATLCFTLKSILNFMNQVDKVLDNREIVEEMNSAVAALYDVKTLVDFKHWEDNIGRYVDSNPVKSSAIPTLEEFMQ